MRVMIYLLLLLSACSTPAVRCDKHVEPINAPAPKIDPTSGNAATTPHRRLP
jgi:uncharacterized lipoprotein YmbA